jgi:hypothetical protein
MGEPDVSRHKPAAFHHSGELLYRVHRSGVLEARWNTAIMSRELNRNNSKQAGCPHSGIDEEKRAARAYGALRMRVHSNVRHGGAIRTAVSVLLWESPCWD